MKSKTSDKHQVSTTHSLKERQREERTNLILQAAYEVLVEKGYYDASINEIARRVGISIGTVYLHFESKEDLVVALIEQEVVRFLALIDQVVSEKTTVRTRVEHILMHTYSGIRGERQTLLELTNMIGLTKNVIEKQIALQSKVTARVTEITKRIEALFEEGKRTGELDETVPTAIMVATFIALVSVEGYQWFLTSGQYSPEDLIASISHILFRGFLAPSARES